MYAFRIKGQKGSYSFVNERCIGRECWQPGSYQSRGSTSSGSRSTGNLSLTCMQRAYRGCPDGPEGASVDDEGHRSCGLPLYSEELAKKRKAEGWR